MAAVTLTSGTVTNEGTARQFNPGDNGGVARARRVRGALLRLVLNRPLAGLAGVAVMVPAVWLLITDYAWESGLTEGLTLLALATGAALLWTGLTGRQPDWVDPDR